MVKIDRQIDKRRVTNATKIHSKKPTEFKVVEQFQNQFPFFKLLLKKCLTLLLFWFLHIGV